MQKTVASEDRLIIYIPWLYVPVEVGGLCLGLCDICSTIVQTNLKL